MHGTHRSPSAAGYNNSTYTLSYDAANDLLTDVCDQVVVKQKFEVLCTAPNRDAACDRLAAAVCSQFYGAATIRHAWPARSSGSLG
jgi:hypothetical protein